MYWSQATPCPRFSSTGRDGSAVLSLLVVLDDLRRQDRRAVALAAAKRLGVVRLVAVHPADDGRIVLVRQPDGVLARR